MNLHKYKLEVHYLFMPFSMNVRLHRLVESSARWWCGGRGIGVVFLDRRAVRCLPNSASRCKPQDLLAEIEREFFSQITAFFRLKPTNSIRQGGIFVRMQGQPIFFLRCFGLKLTIEFDPKPNCIPFFWGPRTAFYHTREL